MPKSKRPKTVHLTETRKKGLESKQKLIEGIRENVDSYARIFTFSTQNMRNNKLKDVRCEWRHSTFLFGKNKVTMVALGKDQQSEYRDNLHKVSAQLWGEKGLLFTNKTKEEVVQWFNGYTDSDFARSGNLATKTILIEKGPLFAFPHSLEPHLRTLNMPVNLQKGVIHLLEDFTVCKKGTKLTPEQARILKLFGHQMADFKIRVESMWTNDGTFEEFADTDGDQESEALTLKAPEDYDEAADEDMKDAAEGESEEDDDDEEEEEG